MFCRYTFANAQCNKRVECAAWKGSEAKVNISAGGFMRIGQMGFGKTGKAVANVLLESEKCSLEWVLRKSHRLEHRSVAEFLGVDTELPGHIHAIDEFSPAELLDRYPVDIIVDFSSPQGIHYYGDEARKRGIIVISAVSEYPAETNKYLRELAQDTVVIHSPNITLGINFLLIAAKILQNIAPYTDVEIIEEHFKLKPEVSGTSRVIATGLGVDHTTIKSVRAGGIIGVHEILFGFPYQTVRLKHESISREAFGNGVVFVVENLPNAKAGFFTMEDLLLPHFKLNRTEADFAQQKQRPWWWLWK